MGRFSPQDCPVKLMCPFSIRFCQAKVDCKFQSGSAIDEMVDQINVREGDHGICILDAPFDPIVVILWRPRLKDKQGNQLHDPVTKEKMRGHLSWFALDNRRLYCLQRRAALIWPQPVRCPVHVLDLSWSCGRMDDPRVLNLRKFNTVDAGRTVSICRPPRSTKPTHWSWMDAIDRSDPRTMSTLCFVHEDAKITDLSALEDTSAAQCAALPLARVASASLTPDAVRRKTYNAQSCAQQGEFRGLHALFAFRQND